MSVSRPNPERVRLDGKFFRLGAGKFYVKGVSYGPFPPDSDGDFFPSRRQVLLDFERIKELGANTLRVYYVPPSWFLDLAQEHGLKLLVDVPWDKHLCFLEGDERRTRACRAVAEAAKQCASHPAVFALSVVNEIPPDVVRWSGPAAVADFIDELVEIVKAIEPDCLCTFGNFPPTEFLRPSAVDFLCFNVYLHQPRPFANYLARLQMIADSKPLILGEFGIDSMREGEARKSEILSWKIETSFRSGLAGAVVYSFTDEWFKEGQTVQDWAFGLTASDRTPKESFWAVQKLFRLAPYFPLAREPLISVVVASFNGERTLPACLESLERLNYPSYEIILVDDGSTDKTAEIAATFQHVRYVAHASNLGLSSARNTGIQTAKGEIVAFTDADCRADEDWLYYLASDLLNSDFVGVGGHNLLPPEDSCLAAAVMVSPGGPAHVMLTDRIAEHIPGCNMAFYRWALEEIGGFDPLFKKAGDDVDVCWRLQQAGHQLGFSSSGFVWHYRRSTVREYIRQQHGYGEAEALLVYRHPEYFNWYGASQWQGRIYSPAKCGVVARSSMVYHGTFASGFFQTLYSPPPVFGLMFATSLEYHVLVTLPLVVLGALFKILLPLAITSALVSVVVCVTAAIQAEIPKPKRRFWSVPLVAVLFFLQPIVRGWARYQGRIALRPQPLSQYENLDSLSLRGKETRLGQVQYWSDKGPDRIQFVRQLLKRLDERGWQNKADAGWNEFDIEVYGSRWAHLRLTTASEALGHGRQLIRCRLQPNWTLFARVLLCLLCGIELLAIGLFAREHPWLWLILLTIPFFDWFLSREQKHLQRIMVVFLDGVAQECGLVKVKEEPGERPGDEPEKEDEPRAPQS